MAVPIPLSDITLYIMRSQNFTCRKRCFQKYKEQRSHDLCYLKCEEDSCKFVVRLLEKELKRCERNHFNNNKKKRKCKKQVYKMLKQWKGRQVKAHIKLIQSNKMFRIKARLKQKALNK